MSIPVYSPSLGVSEMEIGEALGNYIKGIPIPGGMGAVHTRGKYGLSDAAKVMLLKAEPGEYDEYGIQGLFILPSEYTEPTDEKQPNMGEVIQGVIYEFTYIHESNEDVIPEIDPLNPDNPVLTSFDHFRQHIDYMRRWLNNNTHFGNVSSKWWHTRLRSSEPLYDDEIPDVGLFHFGKFNLEMRYLTPTKC